MVFVGSRPCLVLIEAQLIVFVGALPVPLVTRLLLLLGPWSFSSAL